MREGKLTSPQDEPLSKWLLDTKIVIPEPYIHNKKGLSMYVCIYIIYLYMNICKTITEQSMKKRLFERGMRSWEELVGEDVEGAGGNKKKRGSDAILFYLNTYVCNSSKNRIKVKNLSLQYV